MYYPAPIVFKMQNRKETIVEFLRDAIKEWVCMYLCTVYYHCTVLSVYSCFMKHIEKENYLRSLSCELDPSLVFVAVAFILLHIYMYIEVIHMWFITVKKIETKSEYSCHYHVCQLPTWKVCVNSPFLTIFVTLK
jgi:hypothetical protein